MKATRRKATTECMVTPNMPSGSENSNVGVIIAIKKPSENDLRAAKWKPAHHLKVRHIVLFKFTNPLGS